MTEATSDRGASRSREGALRHGHSIEIRDEHFHFGGDIPRYWHGGRRSVSLYMNGLSVFFPVGEQFFVRSVKAHRQLVNDARLLEEVRLFCGQEGIHGREHIQYNEMLRAQGYPVAEMEERVRSLLDRVRRQPQRIQLAVTASLEHFTAILARSLLSVPATLEGAHPEMAALWRWHAAEESEHKAVAYDVYRAAGGYYAERVVVMLATTVIFLAKMAEHTLRLMRTDRISTSLREWGALFRFLFATGGTWQLVTGYLAWYGPRFHPDDLDTRALLATWKQDHARACESERGAPASP
jgi:predicted metal-dependent hydrolase